MRDALEWVTIRTHRRLAAFRLAAGLAVFNAHAPAQASGDRAALPETVVIDSRHSFNALVGRLEQAVEANRMGLVARASASAGAAARGVKIPGNVVLMVFRNDFAVRMLAASVPAGIEAPLRIYVTERADGGASVAYRTPSSVFAPYRNPELAALARELDPIFAKIVQEAASE